MKLEEKARVGNEAPAKKKLTLSVDEEVVRRAKSLGFNLSEFTESVLDAYAFTPEKTAKNTLYQKYGELFASMKPLLEEYGASVEVALWMYDDGEGNEGEVKVVLESDGKLRQHDSLDMDESGNEVPRPIEIAGVSSLFYPTKTILENFIKAITEAKERRAERISELEMAKRMVEAIWTPAARHEENPKPGPKGK
jgi:post-segregation antitoxin (ccd killing protein)